MISKKESLLIYAKLLFVFVALFMMVGMAKAGSASVSASGGSVEVGQNVSVTVSARGDTTFGVKIVVSYDSSILELVSYPDNAYGGGGTVIIAEDSLSSSSYSYSLTFKGIAAGTSSISTSVGGADAFDANLDPVSVSCSGGSVTVTNGRPTDTDNTLANLVVGQGTISPAFSKTTTAYTVNVPADVNSLTITAPAASQYAKVAITGNSGLSTGSKVTVTVTAEDGSKKAYVISVTKSEPTATPIPSDTPIPTPGVKVMAKYMDTDENGKLQLMEAELQFAEIISAVVPDGFTKDVMTKGGINIEILKHEEGDLVLVELSDGKLYVYDEENEMCFPYARLNTVACGYIICVAPEDKIPAGYSEVGVNVNGSYYPGYAIHEDDEFVLFYTEDGNWYKYDTFEGTFQRFVTDTENALVSPTPTPEAAAEITPGDAPTDVTPTENPEQAKTGGKLWDIIKTVITILVFILAIVFMILFVREKNRFDEYKEIYGDDDEEDEPAESESDEAGSEASEYAEKVNVLDYLDNEADASADPTDAEALGDAEDAIESAESGEEAEDGYESEDYESDEEEFDDEGDAYEPDAEYDDDAEADEEEDIKVDLTDYINSIEEMIKNSEKDDK